MGAQKKMNYGKDDSMISGEMIVVAGKSRKKIVSFRSKASQLEHILLR
jgi:hypothetical protein